jgi:CheY-like chemotaxis protein
MSKEILIAEDSRLDSETIAGAAQQWGTTTRIESFAALMETLNGAHRYDLLILDLRMDGTDPRNTVQAVQLAIDKLRLPVIVVTGYPDKDLQRDCELRGWLWVDKESQRFKADLYRAIQRSFDGNEDSGDTFVAMRSSREQLEAIVGKLDRMEAKQSVTFDQLTNQIASLQGQLEAVLDQVWGPIVDVRTGRRAGGCAATCERTKNVFDFGKAWLLAAVMGTSGVLAALISWIVSKATQ